MRHSLWPEHTTRATKARTTSGRDPIIRRLLDTFTENSLDKLRKKRDSKALSLGWKATQGLLNLFDLVLSLTTETNIETQAEILVRAEEEIRKEADQQKQTTAGRRSQLKSWTRTEEATKTGIDLKKETALSRYSQLKSQT